MPSQAWQRAVDRSAGADPQARIVVVDVATGKLLAASHLAEASQTLAAPGSALKPIVLYGLLKSARCNPQQRVACDRKLSVARHRLACSHPATAPFDAQEALAWSCNSYFAALARSIHPGQLDELLRPSGLLAASGLSRSEAIGEYREPRSAESMELAVLGVEGIRVTPLELAQAYRWLAEELAGNSASPAAQTVRAGLADSASFGIAGAASLGGVPVLGKTGTAEGAQTSKTHGWFVGIAPADHPQVVLAVYVPTGHGADAARVAGRLLASSPLRKP